MGGREARLHDDNFPIFCSGSANFQNLQYKLFKIFATTLYIYIIHISSTIPETSTQGSRFQAEEQENAFTNINKGNE